MRILQAALSFPCFSTPARPLNYGPKLLAQFALNLSRPGLFPA